MGARGEARGSWTRFPVAVLAVFRSGEERARRGSSALWVPTLDAACGCPRLLPGRRYLLLGGGPGAAAGSTAGRDRGSVLPVEASCCLGETPGPGACGGCRGESGGGAAGPPESASWAWTGRTQLSYHWARRVHQSTRLEVSRASPSNFPLPPSPLETYLAIPYPQLRGV